MNEKNERLIYNISQVILTVLAFLIFIIILINEDESWNIVIAIFTVMTFIISFPSKKVSKKIINYSDKMDKKSNKVRFYLISLPASIFLVHVIVYAIVIFFILIVPMIFDFESSSFSESLSIAFIGLFVVASVTLSCIIPYLQSLIVLLLRFIFKENKDD